MFNFEEIKNNVNNLNKQMLERRGRGQVVLRIDEKTKSSSLESVESVDEYMNKIGYKPIGNDWQIISNEKAKLLANYILRTDLSSDTCDDDDYSQYIQNFFEYFSVDVKIFFNGDYSLKAKGIFNVQTASLSGATFDATLCFNDRKLFGILQVMDED